MSERPLTIQGDRTMLLDVHSPDAERCREDIIAFADLVKSPEHVHTYALSPLSMWNAISSGITADEIVERLKKWSRYEVDERIIYFIKDQGKRYGDFVLEEYDEDYLILSVRRPIFAIQLKSEKSLKGILIDQGDNTFLVQRMNRGKLKALMIKLGFPIDDRIPLKKGKPLKVQLKDTFTARAYQKEAAASLLGNGEKGTGFGTIVLPCGSGKTIVGMLILEKLSTNTLILCPNITALRQWKRELLDKTELKAEDIGEYSGERKEIKPVTICTYQVLSWKASEGEEYKHFEIFRDKGWGLIIYDEVHMLPAPVFRITAELQAIHRVGLTATLIREDGLEGEVFSLVGPKRYDTPWLELEKQGFIAKAYCHEIRIPLPESLEVPYAIASGREKFRIAAENPTKADAVKVLLEKHKDDAVLIIGQYIEQLKTFQSIFGFPLITGTMANRKRDELYQAFREGREKVLLVSKVANNAIDLPDASVLIEISGTFGSRQEEAQRLGRILRPKNRDSHFYTLVTEYSREEEFAQNRQKFLSEQGYSYTIERF